jgi:hypothetical protein
MLALYRRTFSAQLSLALNETPTITTLSLVCHADFVGGMLDDEWHSHSGGNQTAGADRHAGSTETCTGPTQTSGGTREKRSQRARTRCSDRSQIPHRPYAAGRRENPRCAEQCRQKRSIAGMDVCGTRLLGPDRVLSRPQDQTAITPSNTRRRPGPRPTMHAFATS